MLNLPNILTLMRIVMIPVFCVVYYLPYHWGHPAASGIFFLACLTDWLDGYLARVLKLSTPFGAFLDPVADKMMVSIALVMIVAERQFQYMNLPDVVMIIPAFIVTMPAAIIVSREILVSALREWMAEVGQRKSVVVSSVGKIKTFVQMSALTVLAYCSPWTNLYIVLFGYVLLCIAAILTIWSMILYLKAAWPQFKS